MSNTESAPSAVGRDRSKARHALAIGGVAGVLASYNEAESIYKSVKERWQVARSKKSWTVEISERDVLFNDVVLWVETLIRPGNRRALQVRSSNEYSSSHDSYPGESVMDSDDDSAPKRKLVVGTPTSANIEITVDGHEATAAIAGSGGRKQDDGITTVYEPPKLIITCWSQEAQQTVIRHVEELLRKRETQEHKPVIRILDSRWNGWNRRGDLPPRPLESVVLREGQLERLVTDLGHFLSREQEYNQKAIPWHRGYMLEGPPGTGKTSVVKALASHFGMDLWYAPLGDIKDDSSLLSILGQVHARSMVLLEDVDVFSATRERESEKAGSEKVTLSGLLNALDGVATPHGLVTFLTTNQPVGLDGALLRAGRCDVVETLDLPDVEQATRLFHWFYGSQSTVIGSKKIDPCGRSTADLMETFKQNMDSARDAFAACDSFVKVS